MIHTITCDVGCYSCSCCPGAYFYFYDFFPFPPLGHLDNGGFNDPFGREQFRVSRIDATTSSFRPMKTTTIDRIVKRAARTRATVIAVSDPSTTTTTATAAKKKIPVIKRIRSFPPSSQTRFGLLPSSSMLVSLASVDDDDDDDVPIIQSQKDDQRPCLYILSPFSNRSRRRRRRRR